MDYNNKRNKKMAADRAYEFTAGGTRYRGTRLQIEQRLAGVAPDRVRKYAVDIAGCRYPVTQVIHLGMGVPRPKCQSQQAYRALEALGFAIIEQ